MFCLFITAPVEHEWREHTKKRKVSGELNLICYWEDRRKTRLCVRVARAVDVKAADVEGTSDPYVVGTLRAGVKGVQGREDQVYRTKTVKVTLFWLFWLFLVILVIFGYSRTGNCTDTCVFFISLGDAQSDLEPQLSLSGVSFDGETDTRVADIEARRHRDHHERRVRGSRGQGCQARQGQGEQGEETSRSSRGCRAFIFLSIYWQLVN